MKYLFLIPVAMLLQYRDIVFILYWSTSISSHFVSNFEYYLILTILKNKNNLTNSNY